MIGRHVYGIFKVDKGSRSHCTRRTSFFSFFEVQIFNVFFFLIFSNFFIKIKSSRLAAVFLWKRVLEYLSSGQSQQTATAT